VLFEVFLYLAGIAAIVGGVLLLELVVAGPHATGDTGYASVDSTFDVDRLRRGHHGAWARLRPGRAGRLPVLSELTAGAGQPRDVGERLICVADIVGSVDGASQLFDRDFRPVDDRARARLASVLLIMRQGEPLPPIEVWSWRGGYFVLDGHHRVAAARALGYDDISAHVFELVERPHGSAVDPTPFRGAPTNVAEVGTPSGPPLATC
jgi:hypothetical protein